MTEGPLIWCGKRVDEMDRDELLKAFEHLWRVHQRQIDSHASSLDSWSRFARARARV